MGALAPVTPWIPKDDLLLKTSIEGGASLESLARGAVQFSRRFTFKELQDRWHTLLYDPVISAEASARILEVESSFKAIKAESSKEAKYGQGKRKHESIRRCYYAMRKRICNESLNPSDLSFLVTADDSCFITGVEGPAPQSLPREPMVTHYGLEDANIVNLRNDFPKVMMDSAPLSAVEEFPSGQQNMLEDPIEQQIEYKEVTQMTGSKIAIAGNVAATTQTGPEELIGHDIFQTNGLQSSFRDMNSSISECETSLHHLQYASSPPTMPDWKNNEVISVPEMPEGGSIRGNDMQAGVLFRAPVDSENKASDYDIRAESELKNQISCADMKDSTDCKEGYLAELSDSLFNFACDDEMLIDGGKDVIDKTYLGLSSLLLSSPDVRNEETVSDMPKVEEPAGVDDCHGVPPLAGPEEKNEGGEIHLEHSCDSNQINCESQMPSSSSTVNLEHPETRGGFVLCVLNTEDPVIPCNDAIIFPTKPRPQSSLRRTQSEAFNLSNPGKDTSGSQTTMQREAKRSKESHPDLHTTDSEKYGHQVTAPNCAQTGYGGINQEGQNTSTIRNQECYVLESVDPLVTEPGGKPLLSEDEQFSDSDTDVPYFSDIESMILDMDFRPEDQDSFYSEEVAKYQHEGAKREIIRLEQNAHTYMQRAIAAHRAFAIMYGRHSKHYIKKSEVLIGRGTHDVPVDIDLSSEGPANKISRRQAILKMEKDGTFILRNIGKYSIHVNSKEVSPGLAICLQSNCLIEIRGMLLIFETHPGLVKKYLGQAADKSEAKRLKV